MGNEISRKLASIRVIDEIKPIKDADNIECAIIGGWQVVVKKNEFKVGQAVIYFEIDSFIPHNIAPFLSKGQEPKEFNGIKGERLRTLKLRGTLSQGLIMDYFDFPQVVKEFHKTRVYDPNEKYFDVTEILGVQKYDPPVPAQLGGDGKGAFPYFIPKTDQERIQNLSDKLNEWSSDGSKWEVTEKLDGSSMTVYILNGEIGVCSRNLELKENYDNSLWKTAKNQNVLKTLSEISEYKDLALQGELIGEGIQGNPYKLKGQKYYIFDIFDITHRKYLSSNERINLCNKYNLLHTPVVKTDCHIVNDMNFLLTYAEGKSELNSSTEREGLVYKNVLTQESFKTISNKFLLKKG